ncbi:hypothetical protein SF12_16800, partial [Streptomyces sp. MBRL 601]
RHPALVLYEPAWAIGSAHGAEPGHAATVLETLRSALPRPATHFLYGGAVTPGTYTALRARAPGTGWPWAGPPRTPAYCTRSPTSSWQRPPRGTADERTDDGGVMNMARIVQFDTAGGLKCWN